MPIDEAYLRRLLIQDHLTHGQAAFRLGISIRTVERVVQRLGLQAGRGVRHRWTFTGYNAELAYLVGLYLTDGWTTKAGVGFSSTEPILIQKFAQALHSLGLPLSEDIAIPTATHKGTKPTFVARCYSTLFSRWIKMECRSKTVIPPALITAASVEAQLMFLAGAIDGDGHVTKDGSILIRTTAKWITDLGALLENLHIRHGFRVDRILDSGKPYYCVTIRRADYRTMGGRCFHPIRAWRIMHAKDLRQRSHG